MNFNFCISSFMVNFWFSLLLKILKSKSIICIILCFRYDSKFWLPLHTCFCERLTYVPYEWSWSSAVLILITTNRCPIISFLSCHYHNSYSSFFKLTSTHTNNWYIIISNVNLAVNYLYQIITCETLILLLYLNWFLSHMN